MSEHRKKNRTNFYRSILSNKDFMNILSPDTENDAWRLDIVQKSLWVFEIFFWSYFIILILFWDIFPKHVLENI